MKNRFAFEIALYAVIAALPVLISWEGPFSWKAVAAAVLAAAIAIKAKLSPGTSTDPKGQTNQ